MRDSAGSCMASGSDSVLGPFSPHATTDLQYTSNVNAPLDEKYIHVITYRHVYRSPPTRMVSVVRNPVAV